jgi:hypothetical protein
MIASVVTTGEAGKVMTISLWESREHLLAVEERAAELNGRATRSGDIAAPDIAAPDIAVYEMVVRA